jgi:hypothetical protein
MICATRTAVPLDTITLFPKKTGLIDALSNWGTTPAVGDSVLVLDERSLFGEGDDRWVAYEVRAVTPVTGLNGCPWKGKVSGDSTPLLFDADTVRPSYKVALDRTLGKYVMVGAPVRFFRRVRYEVYQAPDGNWYLGYSDCLRTRDPACSEVAPVSGPYMPYTGIAGENGLTFVYYDEAGNILASTAQPRLISRIDVVLRSQTANPVTRTGAGAGGHYRDSLVVSIGIRNRR